jgi:ketosteroid isomerase-like protein
MSIDDSNTGLNAALEWLFDKDAIGALLHAYAWHFDHNEPEAIADLFTDDVVIDYGPEFPPIRGRETIVDRIRPGLDGIFEATSHHLSNISISPSGTGEAQGTAYVHAWHRYRDGSPDGYLWGYYACRFRRTSTGWRISKMALCIAGKVDFHRSTMHPIGRRG